MALRALTKVVALHLLQLKQRLVISPFRLHTLLTLRLTLAGELFNLVSQRFSVDVTGFVVVGLEGNISQEPDIQTKAAQ